VKNDKEMVLRMETGSGLVKRLSVCSECGAGMKVCDYEGLSIEEKRELGDGIRMKMLCTEMHIIFSYCSVCKLYSMTSVMAEVGGLS